MDYVERFVPTKEEEFITPETQNYYKQCLFNMEKWAPKKIETFEVEAEYHIEDPTVVPEINSYDKWNKMDSKLNVEVSTIEQNQIASQWVLNPEMDSYNEMEEDQRIITLEEKSNEVEAKYHIQDSPVPEINTSDAEEEYECEIFPELKFQWLQKETDDAVYAYYALPQWLKNI